MWLKILSRIGLLLAIFGVACNLMYAPVVFPHLPHWMRHQLWQWSQSFNPICVIGMLLAIGFNPGYRRARD